MSAKVPGSFDGTVRAKSQTPWIVAAIALILIGAFMLFTQFATVHFIALLVLPLAGAVLLGWGLLSRMVGLLVPGGVLLGLGGGVALAETIFSGQALHVQAGIALLGFAAGWLLTMVLARAGLGHALWWPLIPALLCLAAGVALLFIEHPVVTTIGRFWPVLLIIAGLIMLIRRPN